MRLFLSSIIIAAAAGLSTTCAGAAATSQTAAIKWKDCLKQKPEWYATSEALRIADNVLLYQFDCGGWNKNIDMAKPLSETDRAKLADPKTKGRTDATIDNGATRVQLAYLAKAYSATRIERFRDGFFKGLDTLLKAQYGNGGWPQYFPKATGYHTHITFNDGAMTGVLNLLNDVAHKQPSYAFVDEERRAKAERAVAKGIECILGCQVAVSGKRTVWCAQHDEATLKPASARSYEKESLSGAESVGVVEFLMSVDRPSSQVVEAVQSAVAWFDQARLTGIKAVDARDPADPKKNDRIVVQDATAPPLWARFYEIGTNRPTFCGRDGVIKYSLAEIERERRRGYSWYGSYPAGLLAKEYPAWQAKWAPGQNVLGASQPGKRS